MENSKIEWKEAWQDEYMRTICAFANASGGVLEIGRRDDGAIIGVTGTKKLLEDLPNKIKSAMAIITDINVHESDGKHYIAINVGAYPFPISYRGVYYIRTGSTTQELTGAALDEFMLRKQGKTWDGIPVPYIGLDDFESGAFKAFRRKAIGSARLTAQDLEITDEMLLKNLRLVEGDYIKRAALLMFHQDPENWVPGAYIKVGFFENAADLLHQDEIHGPLITMADKTEELIYLKYFKGIISYKGLQRIENYPVPRTAFREAVLNAIVHRDYSTGNPIHIHIYPDKMLIYNDGRLPENWTEADLFMPHTSKPYNPLIASTFFRSGQIEAWGRGVEKMATTCKEWGKPEPFYRIRSNEVMIGFDTDIGEFGEKFGENAGEYGEKFGENTDEFGENAGEYGENAENIVIDAGSVVENNVEFSENKTSEKIMNIMRLKPTISAKTIAEEIGLTTRGVEKNIHVLKDLGLIERVGPAKGGHWVVKTM
ncbi:MAG: putative DNA binding domain-containing protein [Chitinispirillales bacterium]|nr:putative DNA binding domain-containing protein [Chitinispirillales bacterium]